MFNSFTIKKYLDCKDYVRWKSSQLISPHVILVQLPYYNSDDYQMCNEYADDSQIKLPNQICQGNCGWEMTMIMYNHL